MWFKKTKTNISKSFPSGISCCDVAVYAIENGHVFLLLGQKPAEEKYRFVGGFFDYTLDNSLEDTARRELSEEIKGDLCFVGGGRFQYLSSHKVDDKRYKNDVHRVISSLFIVEVHLHQMTVEAGDDLARARFFKLGHCRDIIMPEHKPLLDSVDSFLTPF